MRAARAVSLMLVALQASAPCLAAVPVRAAAVETGLRLPVPAIVPPAPLAMLPSGALAPFPSAALTPLPTLPAPPAAPALSDLPSPAAEPSVPATAKAGPFARLRALRDGLRSVPRAGAAGGAALGEAAFDGAGRFPAGFLWGTATAAYQIEGGNRNSTFWDWERRRGWERSGDADRSWDLWRQDIAAMKALNVNAYRFSVEWSRVEPRPGVFDEAALARYVELARALQDAGIRPIVTLHHYSEPAWLLKEAPGGWMSAKAPRLYARFADTVTAALGPYVSDWITFNEPTAWLAFGYGVKLFPPGLNRLAALLFKRKLLPNVARAHDAAYRLIHARRADARVSIAQQIAYVEPASGRLSDRLAARWWDRWFHYSLLDRAARAGTLDFVGVNYYTRVLVGALRWRGLPLPFPMPGYAEVEKSLGPARFAALGGRRGPLPKTDVGWEVYPDGLRRVANAVWRRYGLPVMITENGVADASGALRAAYLRDHVAALAAAQADGVPLLGYMHWSLIDNWEWGSWAPRFGLFRVQRDTDYARVPAPGAAEYARIAGRNGL